MVTALVVASAGTAAVSSGATQTHGTTSVIADYAEYRAELERRERERQVPSERERRRRSRTAYADASDGDAQATARDHHPDVLGGPVWRMPDGITQFLSDQTARVELEGRPSLLVSMLPLRAPDANGEKRPIDLGLERRGNELGSKNPLAPVAIGERAGDGLRFEDAGVELIPQLRRGDAPARIADGKVFYPNADIDTDMLVTPVPSGVETFLMLRSERSPEAHSLRVELPAGAELREDPEIEGGASVVRDGKRLVTINPPLAWDADREPFRVRYVVHDDVLEMRFPHRDQDLRYPLVVDPFASQGFFDDVRDWPTWGFWDSPGGIFDNPWSPGYLHVQTNGGRSYSNGNFGLWYYVPQGTAYAWRFEAWSHYRNGNRAGELIEGLWSPTKTPSGGLWNGWWQAAWRDGNGASYTWGPSKTLDNRDYQWQQHCIVPGCNPPTGDTRVYSRTEARFGVHIYDASKLPGAQVWAQFNAGAVYVDDPEAPTLTVPTGAPSGWVTGGTVSLSARSTDPGLGVRLQRLTRPSRSATGGSTSEAKTAEVWRASTGHWITCDGLKATRCPSDWTPPTPFTIPVDDLPDGVNTPTIYAEDLNAHRSVAHGAQIKVDRTKPQLTLSNELAALEGKRIRHDGYALTVNATDAHSGVAAIKVWVNDVEQGTSPPPCDGDGCSLPRTFDFRATEPGIYRIKVKAFDKVGNQSDEKVITVYHDPPLGYDLAHTYREEALPGGLTVGVNVGSGDLVARSTDLVLGAGTGTNINLARTYNSRARSRQGSLGLGWTSGLGPDIQLVQDDGGAAEVLFTPSDGPIRFVKNADGTYTPQRGHWSLTRNSDGTFDATDESDYYEYAFASTRGSVRTITDDEGRVTTFTYASNGALASVQDTKNETTTFATDSSKRITSATRGSQTYGYSYNAGGRLQQTTDPAGAVTTYEYDANGYLGAINAPGARRKFTYLARAGIDRVGSIVRVTDTAADTGPTTNFAYPEKGYSRTAQWRLDETSGSQAQDSAASNHGTYSGGYTLNHPGATADTGRAVLLNGVNGRMTTGYNPFAAGSARTFEGWAKRNSNSTADTLFAGDSFVGYPVLRALGGNDVRFNPDTTGAGQDFINALPGTGVWFHWALVWDGAARTATLYVDGVSKGTLTFGFGFGGLPGNIELGAEGSGTANPFDGYLDEVSVYPFALSAAAVARLRNNTAGASTEVTDPEQRMMRYFYDSDLVVTTTEASPLPSDYGECRAEGGEETYCQTFDRDVEGADLAGTPDDPEPALGDADFSECFAEEGATSTECANLYNPADDISAAASGLKYGIANDNPASATMVTHDRYKALHVNHFRRIVPWNIMNWKNRRTKKEYPAIKSSYVDFKNFYNAAKSSNKIVVAFGRRMDFGTPGQQRANDRKELTTDRYGKAVRRFKSRFPDVDYLIPWNEPNHRSQPLNGTSGARRLAKFTKAVQRNACSGCVIAGEVVDDIKKGPFIPYVEEFEDALDNYSGAEPAIWSIHSYNDIANEPTAASSRLRDYKVLLNRILPSGLNHRVWVTEAGARIEPDFRTINDEVDQGRQLIHFDGIARTEGVDRWLYYHLWEPNDDSSGHDTGLLPSGSGGLDAPPRNAYFCFRRRTRPALNDSCQT